MVGLRAGKGSTEEVFKLSLERQMVASQEDAVQREKYEGREGGKPGWCRLTG